MNKKKKMPCIFYFYIHFKLKERYWDGAEITTKDAMSFLFKWRLPKIIRPVIIKELELLNLVERINKRIIKIKPSTFNPEDIGRFYKAVGIY